MTDTQKAAQVQKMHMTEALEKVKAETVIYENDIRKQTELMGKSRNEVLSAEKKVTYVVDECIRQLREYEKAMKAKLAEIYEAQQKYHATSLENFELVLTQLKSCVERGESIVERNISAEILQTNQAIIGRCEELLTARRPDIYKPSHVHYLVEKKENILDRIVISDTDPSLSSLEQFLPNEKLREKTHFTIVTRNSDGQQCYHKDDQIKVNISTPAGEQLETEITDTNDGKYTVTYTPQCVGQHRVETQVNGEPLTGSPWVVQVIPHQYQFAFQFGSKGKEQGQFDEPCFIAVIDKTERVAVFDTQNDRTQIFNFEGKFLKQKRSSLLIPSSDGNIIFVSDGDTHHFVSTEDGQHIRSVDPEHIEEMLYIVLENNDRIIMCHGTDKTVKVLSPDGKHVLQSFKAPDCDEVPFCVIHHQRKFFVSYPHANRVMVFSDAGEYLFDIGSEGSGDGQLKFPFGLAVDKFNHLIVCDSHSDRLQLFTLDGKFVSKIAGSFFENSSIAYCAVSFNTGHLFVTDLEKHCVYVFTLN